MTEGVCGTLIVICGLPCAGKTTLARRIEVERSALRMCPDEWIAELLPEVWDRAELDRYRDPVEGLQWDLAQRALALGVNVVLEFGSWGRGERDALRAGAREVGAGFEFVYLDVPLAVLQERVDERNALSEPGTFKIDSAELQRCWSTIERPSAEELRDNWMPACV